MKVAVIGAGNGGQAIAAYLSMKGHEILLYDRNKEKTNELSKSCSITLKGMLSGTYKINHCSDNLEQVVKDSEVIMVVTTALAHKELATKMGGIIQDGQIIILNPGRTGGAIEFRNNLQTSKKVYIAETQTLIFACREESLGVVNIIGIKQKVFISSYPSKDNYTVIKKAKAIFEGFTLAENVLRTSFENYGAMFHPSIVLFNMAAIERNEKFYFYRDLTPSICDFIERLDNERLAIGRAYNLELVSASDWIVDSYSGVKGNTLLERMKNNPAYNDIISPASIYARQILEDIPTGIVPFVALAKQAGVAVPLMESLAAIASQFYNMDFYKTGRNTESLGIDGLTASEIFRRL